jgi:phenylpropionate dioxygenase-like ring-hydroxylating dioxygenase large terminal subunit
MNTPAKKFEVIPKEELAHLGTDPIPAEAYYSEEYFALECEAVFKRNWLQIAHVCEVPEPGSFIVRTVDFAKVSLLITHGKDGKIRAFHNVCPHRGTQLVSQTSGKKSMFSCPYHMWTFSNEGDLRSAPDFERFYVDKSDCGLKVVAAEVCAGMIFINLDKSPKQSLREYLGPMAERLEKLPVARATAFSEYVYEVDANWKLTYDNFQENYHLRFIHPRSGAATSGKDNPYGYPSEYGFHDPHRTQAIWANPDAEVKPFQKFAFGKGARFVMEDGFDFAERTYYGIFPNLFVLGTAMTPFSQNIMPISAGKSRSTIRLYWVGEDDSASRRFAREYAMATALDIHSEDRSVIEAGQRGLSSGALTHIHFQSQEVLCRHLFNEIDQRVQAYKAEKNL